MKRYLTSSYRIVGTSDKKVWEPLIFVFFPLINTSDFFLKVEPSFQFVLILSIHFFPLYNLYSQGFLRKYLLLSLHSDEYYINTTSLPFMKNVLVLTMPNTRNYTINSNVNDTDAVRTQDIKITLPSWSLSLERHYGLWAPYFSGVGDRMVVYICMYAP